MPNELFQRKTLDQVCTVPDDIISVYIAERHIWANDGSDEARRKRQSEKRTVEEFLVDPVRPFLNDIFQHLSAPYEPERRDIRIGQGYWIQAEFGSGKSHVLSLIGSLALGDESVWKIVQKKEEQAGRGKRDSLYTHWENGLAKKSKGKGIFVVVKTLVGAGSGTVGMSGTKSLLVEYILEAIQEQFRAETGKSIALLPPEILAQRFLKDDLERYRKDLEKYLRDPKYFDSEQFETLDEFLSNLQNKKDPGRQKDCGRRLWDFYEQYLEIRPKIPMETEQVLENAVKAILAEGYAGILLILDEVSLFMKNRQEDQRVEDEKTLVVLSNRLVHNSNLPVWTVCAAQQAIESRAGVKNIIANERLKLIPLLNDEKSYYDIALHRVRTITDADAPAAYYEDYRKAFTWPEGLGKDEFARFFPFYPPAIDVVRSVTSHLTTLRSALYFMLQALKTARKRKQRELISLWAMFDDVVTYEEDPSGTTQGITSIKTKWEAEWWAYEAAKKQIGSATKGEIKRWRSRCERILKTLFLYHVATMRTDGLTAEEIMNAVMEWRDHDEGQTADKSDNQAHYQVLLDKIDLELPQVKKAEKGYVFAPTRSGVDWNDVFRKARTEAEQNPSQQSEAWKFLLQLDDWVVESSISSREMIDGHRSIFYKAAADGQQAITLDWKKREISGRVYVRDLLELAKNRSTPFPLDSAATNEDFLVYVSDRPCDTELNRLIKMQKDARVMFWTPDEPTASEKELLVDMAAYRSLVKTYNQETEEARTVLDQIQSRVKQDLGKIIKIVPDRYGRGRLCSTDHKNLPVTMAGDLASILQGPVATVLDATYVSKDLDLSRAPATFTDDEALKVITGIVAPGEVAKDKRHDKNVSAVQNYAVYLGIVKPANEKKLDTSGSIYVRDIFEFLKTKIEESGPVPVDTLYKNFMGIGGPKGKNYGLSRRLIDLFLLCLVRDGKVRVTADDRQVDGGSIDYGTIEGIQFKRQTLEAMREVQLMKAPEGWEILRPFVAVLLDDEKVSEASRDAEIQAAITRLLAKLKELRAPAGELERQLSQLLDALDDKDNPIKARVAAWKKFVDTEADPLNPVPHILGALDSAFGYRAYAEQRYDQAERDDFAVRKNEIGHAQGFVKHDADLRAAKKYAGLDVQEEPLKEELKPHLKRVRKSLQQLQLLIQEPAKLVADLVQPLDEIRERYLPRFMQAFDAVFTRTDDVRTAVAGVGNTPQAKALEALNHVTALVKANMSALEEHAIVCQAGLFPDLKADDVRRELAETPEPVGAGNLIADAPEWIRKADAARAQVAAVYATALLERAESLRSPGLLALLEQGKGEPFIAEVLAAKDAPTLAALLARALPADPGKAKLLDKYLKKIRVRQVTLSRFDPGVATFGREDLDKVVKAFRVYLEKELDGGAGETVVLKLEKHGKGE